MSQPKDAPPLPRRFYKSASVVERDGGFGVNLDARTLRTPGGLVFVSPTQALAQLCADEWDAQGEHIIPASMMASQLAFATLDWTAKNRDDICDYVAKFGETDLCCHRADSPQELVALQTVHWDPLVAWGEKRLGVRLPVVNGVLAADVDAGALAALRAQAAAFDDFKLTALAQTTGLAGSALIGFAMAHGEIEAERAFQAAALDHLWALERWGEDAEGRARLDRQRAEFVSLARFLDALQ